MYELFNDAFAQLPIATRVNEKVLVLHGGIDDDVDLGALAVVPRAEYVVNATNSSVRRDASLLHLPRRHKASRRASETASPSDEPFAVRDRRLLVVGKDSSTHTCVRRWKRSRSGIS